MKPILCFVTLLVLSLFSSVKANDIVVGTATLTGQDVSAGADNAANFNLIEFDLNWNNSWRVSTGPTNWDAAWIFVRYQINSGTGCTPSDNWLSATLSDVGASVINANGDPASISAAADGTGVFIHRAGDGTGAIDWDQIQIRWNYGTDGILDACNVTVKVYAIEMVYIPQADFYLGDGAADRGQFESATSGTPFQVTSEGALTLGGGGVGSVGNNNRAGQSDADDFTDATSQTLSASFPKGWEDFYTMKYEITQEQYMEFLNVLTATQQLARHGATAANRYITNATAPPDRNGVKCVTLPIGATVGVYACDLNNNSTVNESDDGQNVAMNNMSAMDLLSYLDWAGLRPMTEMELEKTGRGNLPAALGEYAWGSSTLYATSYAALTNGGAGDELPNSPSATLGNAAYGTTTNVGGIQGPLRAGIFATASSTRVAAGASYYGAMEITGNVWEIVVGIGHAAGRSFTGLHGDGEITAAGFANIDFWPGANGNGTKTVANTSPNTGSTSYAGMMFRSGSWRDTPFLTLSDRQYSSWTGFTGRERRVGGRGVRTAP